MALDIWCRDLVHKPETMALVHFSAFCAARYDINAVITHTW